MVINPQSRLTKFSGSSLCLLGGRCYLKLLCVDPMLLHQLLALVLMQVKIAYLHCAAGSGQLDEGKKLLCYARIQEISLCKQPG